MFGWLDDGHMQRDLSISAYNSENNATALRAAREAPVLLKNAGNLLPLDRNATHTVLVVGPDAYPGAAVGGGSAGVVPFHQVSLLEGIGMIAPGAKVLYDAGLPTLSELAGRTDFMTAATAGEAGLRRERFASKDLSGQAMTENVKHVNEIGVGWDAISGSLDDLMALFNKPQASSQRFTGFFNAQSAGVYLVALARCWRRQW